MKKRIIQSLTKVTKNFNLDKWEQNEEEEVAMANVVVLCILHIDTVE